MVELRNNVVFTTYLEVQAVSLDGPFFEESLRFSTLTARMSSDTNHADIQRRYITMMVSTLLSDASRDTSGTKAALTKRLQPFTTAPPTEFIYIYTHTMYLDQ